MFAARYLLTGTELDTYFAGDEQWTVEVLA
jgi:hypothetical protein